MTKFRSAAGVVSFKGQIYVLGGHDGLTIFDSVSNHTIDCVHIVFCAELGS